MSVDRTLSTVIGRPDHDSKTTMTRKATAPTITAARCLLTFTARSAQVGCAGAGSPPRRSKRLRLIELDGGHVLAVAVERALLLREDADVLAALHLREHEAAVQLLASDVGGPEHALPADLGPEVVDLGRLLEEAGTGQAVVAVRLHDVVDDVTEEEAGRPRLRREAVGLALPADGLQERGDRFVLLRLLEGDKEQGGVLPLDVGAALAQELGVITREGGVPDLDAVDALDLRLLPHLHRALVVGDALPVRRVVLLDRLGHRRVLALGCEPRDLEEVLVLLDPGLHVPGCDRRRRVDRRLEVAREHPDAVEILVLLLVVPDLPNPGGVRLRVVVLGGAVERAGDHRERDLRALVRHLGLERGHIGEPGHLAGLVDALLHRLHVVEEQCVGSDDREVLLARPDHGVAGLGGAQLRVDEVDLDIAAGQLALGAVDVLGEGPHPVDGALEQTRTHRIVDVRDHGDLDRVGGDADLAVGRAARLVLPRLRPCRRRQHRPAGTDRDGHERPQAPLHRSPLRQNFAPRGSPGAGHCVPNRNVFQDAGRPRMVSGMASPVAERAPAGAIDLLDGDLYAGEPDPTYAWLRHHAPVYRDETNQLWGISRYQDLVAIEKDPQTFCSSEGYRPNLPADDSMIGNDDPRHNERRRLVARRFTPKAVGQHEDVVRETVRGLLDGVAGRGHCEVVEELAAPLPAMVIGRLLGFDDELWSRVKHWSEATIVAGGGPRYMNDGVVEAFGDYCEHAARLMETRQAAPADNVMSLWTEAEAAGVLSTDQVLSESLLPVAVEEFIRWVTPILNMRRTATRDAEVAGTPVSEGDELLLMYPSANRDEEVFDAPERFDVGREPNPHVAFGFGTHFCLGAALARLEIRVMFEELLPRLRDLRLAAGTAPYRIPNAFVRGFRSLHVNYTPA